MRCTSVGTIIEHAFGGDGDDDDVANLYFDQSDFECRRKIGLKVDRSRKTG
jgi:hypothetical protein